MPNYTYEKDKIMNKFLKQGVFLLFLVSVSTINILFSHSSEINSYDFSTQDDLTVMGAGFGQFQQADVQFGSTIPGENSFENATDGIGVTVQANPNEGVMILTPAIPTDEMAMVRCSVLSESPNVAITIAAIDQSENTFISTNSPNNGAFFVGQYKRLPLLVVPPSVGFQALIQVYNPPSNTESVTVYLDNFEVISLDSDQFYNLEYLDGDEIDPETISISQNENPTPTSTSTPVSEITPTPTLPFEIPNYYIITGQVKSSVDGSNINGAKVYVVGFEDQSINSIFGFYTLNITPDSTITSLVLKVEKDGYQPFSITITDLSTNIIQQSVELIPSGDTQSTPTPTDPNSPFPTPTIPDSGEFVVATGIRLSACELEEAIADLSGTYRNTIQVHADLIDAQGNIVNPGLENGETQNVNISMQASGSAMFQSYFSNIISLPMFADQPDGVSANVFNPSAEEIFVTASAPGLTDAEPIALQFVPAGSISGLIRINSDGQYIEPQNGFAYALVIDANTGESFGFTNFSMEPDGQYIISGLKTGVYDIRIVYQDYSMGDDTGNQNLDIIEYENVCIEGISVTAPNDTPNINFDISPRQGSASVYGTITLSDGSSLGSGSVFMVSSNEMDLCTLFTANTEVYSPENSYEITNIPPGEFSISAWGSSSNSLGDSYEATQKVTIADGQAVQVDLVLFPEIAITPITPINYEIIDSSNMTFRWSVPTDSPAFTYTLTIFDRCENQVWYQENINTTEFTYSGPPLDPNDIYSWYVDGSTSGDSPRTANFYDSYENEAMFLVQ
jgi:hypothetical protein